MLKVFKKIFGDKIEYFDDIYESAKDVDGIIIHTEWKEFEKIDFKKLKSVVKNPLRGSSPFFTLLKIAFLNSSRNSTC